MVVAYGGRGKHVRHADNPAAIQLGVVADHKDIRLHHGVNLLIHFLGLGQADTHWGDEGATRHGCKGASDLEVISPATS
jgi:hypothetical protein